MFDFHEKRKIKSRIFSKPTIALLFIASLFLATSVHERYQKERETAHKQAERAAELSTLKARAAVLEAQVKHIQSTRGIEEEIRDRFDATKKGERAVIVVDGTPSTTVATSTSLPEVQEKKHSFFSRLLFWR